MDTQQSLISDKLRECLRDKGYTAVSFAHKAGIPETEFRRFLKTGAFDNNEDEYEEMMDRTLKTLEITMEELLQYQSSTNKDPFFRPGSIEQHHKLCKTERHSRSTLVSCI